MNIGLYCSGLGSPSCPECRADRWRFYCSGDGPPLASWPVCREIGYLCGGCKVVNYCGAAHQEIHRRNHQTECDAIKKARENLELAEAELRAKPANWALPNDVFNTSVGHFWGILDTRPYMRARFAFAQALLKVENCTVAVELALDHFLDMLRLCRTDNMRARDYVPCIMLRLGREQDCYDFIKWWETGTDDGYDWGDMTLPYLNIHGADCFEPVDNLISKNESLSHLVLLTLLKLSLYLQLDSYRTEMEDLSFGGHIDFHITDSTDSTHAYRPRGNMVRSKLKKMNTEEAWRMAERLKEQYDTLHQAVSKRNPWFWKLLIDEKYPSPTASYTYGSKEEAEMTVRMTLRSWREIEHAILMVSPDTADSAPAYKDSPHNAADLHNALNPQPPPGPTLARRRGGQLNVFPSAFKPSLFTTISLRILLHPTSVDAMGSYRFVSSNDPKKVLVYVDGVLKHNGQPNMNSNGGLAVVYGPRPTDVASGPLEKKGPFGNGIFVRTNNRAELRAAIAAMRLSDWRREGFTSLVIATDSTYVADGATTMVRNWLARGWRKRDGFEIRNRDLWELLLGEVERWSLANLLVEFWRIPREHNQDADRAAKQAAQAALSPPLEFQDWEDMFKDIYAGLISRISSKVGMHWAEDPEAALSFLNQSLPPSVILIGDGGIARQKQKKLWDRVIDHLRAGATVILAGSFSAMLNAGEFDRFFARVDVPWRRGSYYRSNTKLRPASVPVNVVNTLPSSYSQKAHYIKNVEMASRWYTDIDGTNGEVAVAYGQVGSGFLGYVGDVNGEKGSEDVVLAMCGLHN
ncbi:hypothetical protein QBC43DRAFT_381795 [Cladorrhinum sp. PSN259]|nr:hypothetical protein QBC43DRAFT_381795 [Cladorrhinum sp. PSN259]